ncbi:cation transporter [bacterium]|nr:cation transporter [bacterium]
MEVKNKILFVVIITIITMIAEILFGFLSNSMALLADGFHMGTHALALGLAYIAYYFCTKFKDNACFKSGTDKIKELSGYTSSLFLGFSGLGIIYESIERIFHPLNISFSQAMIVVVIGLLINLICVLIMDFDDIHNHLHHHEHTHTDRDNNFKSAYFHILADLLTSIFALIALLCAKYFGFVILDPLIGVAGGVIIIKWAINLLKSTARNLLDIVD